MWQHNIPSPQRRQPLRADQANNNAFSFSKTTAVHFSTKTFAHLLPLLRMHGVIHSHPPTRFHTVMSDEETE
jgi:hypothetical protein